jgi:hypothetical protein
MFSTAPLFAAPLMTEVEFRDLVREVTQGGVTVEFVSFEADVGTIAGRAIDEFTLNQYKDSLTDELDARNLEHGFAMSAQGLEETVVLPDSSDLELDWPSPDFDPFGLQAAAFSGPVEFEIQYQFGGIWSGRPGRVALVTDYGLDDFYVGALKGAIVSAYPQVIIDDVLHSVPSFDIAGGSFLLAAAAREWPRGTTFVVVVDPGVGTERRSIVLATERGQLFVGPDNGVFSHVLGEAGSWEAYEILNEALLRPGALSSTFHGRDIYGPIGGYVARGGRLEDLGPRVHDLVQLSITEPALEDGVIHSQIQLADHYGNLLTNVPEALFSELGAERGKTLTVSAGAETLQLPVVRTYADVPVGEPLALINSQGLVELAVNQGSMAERLGVGSGDALQLQIAPAE